MTDERLREIEINSNREDIAELVQHIRHLQFMLEECKAVLKERNIYG